MNEADWLASTDPAPMLAYVRGRVSDRKRYLFACACWRRVLAGWPHPRVQAAVLTGERFADGQATEEELLAVMTDNANPASRPPSHLPEVELLAWSARALAAIRLTTPASVLQSWGPLQIVTRLLAWVAAPFTVGPAESGAQADLVRHIVGNPFRPIRFPAVWPAPVLSLAGAVYSAEDVVFALHDALLDSGHAELAEHFREPEHPKGCWALDLILDKDVRAAG